MMYVIALNVYFSREGLRYAIEKMDSNDKKELLELHSDN